MMKKVTHFLFLTICIFLVGCFTNPCENGHDLVHFEGKEPTCQEIGYEAYDACTRCNYSTYQPVYGEHHLSEWIIDEQANCQKEGKRHKECLICHMEVYHETIKDGEHQWNNGKCEICHLICSHIFDYGQCTICGYQCLHQWNEGMCELCEMECSHELWDGDFCSMCGIECLHEKWIKGECTFCHSKHIDHQYNKGSCDICGVHHDVNNHILINDTCQVCGAVCIHQWINGKCTICNVKINEVFIVNNTKYIYFGDYPQKLKDETVTLTSTVNSQGYILGNDNNYYVELRVNETVNSTGNYKAYFDNGTKIVIGETYYFKVEPIRWQVSNTNNNSLELFSDYIIDNTKYSNATPNIRLGDAVDNYYYSSILRKYLNEDFYNMAFNDTLKEQIQYTTVDNSEYSFYFDEGYEFLASANINDKVFSMCLRDLITASKGYNSDKSQPDSLRQAVLTDYAKAKGCFMITDNKNYNHGQYWLRSPGPYVREWASDYSYIFWTAFTVYGNGSINNILIDNRSTGIRPAITINI